MGYRKISRNVKIAAVRLYERGLLELDDILDCCGFSHRTWYCVLKLWHETGDVIPEAQSLRGRVRTLDREDIDYLLELIRDNPDYFLDELLSLLETNRFISVHYTSTFQSPPNSCRTPQDSAGLQAKVLILVASPAKLGRVGQSLEEFGRTWAEFGRIWQDSDRVWQDLT